MRMSAGQVAACGTIRDRLQSSEIKTMRNVFDNGSGAGIAERPAIRSRGTDHPGDIRFQFTHAGLIGHQVWCRAALAAGSVAICALALEDGHGTGSQCGAVATRVSARIATGVPAKVRPAD